MEILIVAASKSKELVDGMSYLLRLRLLLGLGADLAALLVLLARLWLGLAGILTARIIFLRRFRDGLCVKSIFVSGVGEALGFLKLCGINWFDFLRT